MAGHLGPFYNHVFPSIFLYNHVFPSIFPIDPRTVAFSHGRFSPPFQAQVISGPAQAHLERQVGHPPTAMVEYSASLEGSEAFELK